MKILFLCNKFKYYKCMPAKWKFAHVTPKDKLCTISQNKLTGV